LSLEEATGEGITAGLEHHVLTDIYNTNFLKFQRIMAVPDIIPNAPAAVYCDIHPR